MEFEWEDEDSASDIFIEDASVSSYKESESSPSESSEHISDSEDEEEDFVSDQDLSDEAYCSRQVERQANEEGESESVSVSDWSLYSEGDPDFTPVEPRGSEPRGPEEEAIRRSQREIQDIFLSASASLERTNAMIRSAHVIMNNDMDFQCPQTPTLGVDTNQSPQSPDPIVPRQSPQSPDPVESPQSPSLIEGLQSTESPDQVIDVETVDDDDDDVEILGQEAAESHDSDTSSDCDNFDYESVVSSEDESRPQVDWTQAFRRPPQQELVNPGPSRPRNEAECKTPSPARHGLDYDKPETFANGLYCVQDEEHHYRRAISNRRRARATVEETDTYAFPRIKRLRKIPSSTVKDDDYM